MFPPTAISDRHPFAPPALPGFIAHMGASDFRQPPPSSSLLTLVRGCAAPSTLTAGSPWLPRSLYVRLDAASDPGAVACTCPSRTYDCCLLASLYHRPTPKRSFRDSTPSRSASPVTIAPRLLSRLRINRPVTSPAARLDTRPAANGYLGGTLTH